MAERRMFAKTIIDSDSFLDMPMSTQCLYFHLSMRADDEGFINNPRKVQRMVGASEDDMKLLMAKNFIIAFDTGVVVIKHWKIHNYIRSDRFKPTVYKEEKSLITLKENGAYTLGIPDVCQDGYQMDTQVRLGKDRLGKDRLGEIETLAPYGEYNNVLLSDADIEKLKKEVPTYETYIEKVSSYCQSKGKEYKDYCATIIRWYKDDQKKQGTVNHGFNERKTDYEALEQELMRNAL